MNTVTFTVLLSVLLCQAYSTHALRPLCGCRPDVTICGSNGKTYYSVCEMKCDYDLYPNLYLAYYGECRQRGLCSCPPEYPVCASNGKTYQSVCDMKCEADLYYDLHVVHYGPCYGSSYRG